MRFVPPVSLEPLPALPREGLLAADEPPSPAVEPPPLASQSPSLETEAPSEAQFPFAADFAARLGTQGRDAELAEQRHDATLPEPPSEDTIAEPGEDATLPPQPALELPSAEPFPFELDSADYEAASAQPSLPQSVPAPPDAAFTLHAEPAPLSVAVPESPSGPAPEPRAEPRTVERAETARVDAAVLDALLNGAGEVSIFQSRLKQQVRSIEFHLGELGQTVARLRDQLRKLEAETEAQILHRHQEDLTTARDFDPLELDRYSTIQQLSRALAESANDVASINELLNGLTNEADTLLTQQARVTAELQDSLMQTRMVPFQRHVSRLARIVRQACADTGKQAELSVEGENSELDRQVLETMLPPFEHLLRNAVVHGIEDPAGRVQAGKPPTGRVHLRLRREGSEVLIEVNDDGRGLDLNAIRRKAHEQGLLAERREITDQEAIELIMRPGFSTAGELTQAAGRGVGMDIVDNEVKKLGGSMRIETTAGRGTRFLIRLPYTLAITHALIVNVGDETFALPLPTVEGITRLSRERILTHLTEDEPKLDYGGIIYRIQHLGSLVGAAPSALPDEDSAVSLVLVRAGESSSALLTDTLEGSREIVV
jgi:chemosensory pili system protein ChpA (sensor histidine kinase/response regulator)